MYQMFYIDLLKQQHSVHHEGKQRYPWNACNFVKEGFEGGLTTIHEVRY